MIMAISIIICLSDLGALCRTVLGPQRLLDLGRSYELIVSVVSDVSCVGWLRVARRRQISNCMTA